MTRVCVVGAGPAGLVATKTLLEAGLEVDCYEASTAIGGHWLYDNPNGRSAVYRSIRANTTLAMSRLSDFELPSEWPEFPSHEQIRAWFESYVDHFGFRDRTRLGVEVTAAHALDPTGWRVELRDAGGTTREERYDALLACSGNNWCPRMPDVPGHFEGDLFHAQTYRDPETPVPLAGRRVLVVGIGNTGCELACEIAKAGADAVLLSARSGAWILPKFKEGGRPAAEGVPMMHPCDPVPKALRVLPAPLREGLFERLGAIVFRRMFGERMRRLESLGLPPPPPNPLDKRATVCEPMPDALESGAVEARPAIARFEGRNVAFADGSANGLGQGLSRDAGKLFRQGVSLGILDVQGHDVPPWRK